MKNLNPINNLHSLSPSTPITSLTTFPSPLSLTLCYFFTRHIPTTLGLCKGWSLRLELSALRHPHSLPTSSGRRPLTILFRMSALSPFLQPWKDKGVRIYHTMFIFSTHLKSSNILPYYLFHVFIFSFGSVQFSRSVVSGSLRPHGLQHAGLPCPSLTPRAYSDSCPLSR